MGDIFIKGAWEALCAIRPRRESCNGPASWTQEVERSHLRAQANALWGEGEGPQARASAARAIALLSALTPRRLVLVSIENTEQSWSSRSAFLNQ